MNKETIETIMKWHAETFPDATLDGQIAKFKEECQEYTATGHTDITELADMFIVACGLARFGTVAAMAAFAQVDKKIDIYNVESLRDAINAKMAINRARKWNYVGGKYKHKEA